MNEDCLKLTSYFGERHRAGDRFLADALLDLYGRREVATSILLRGAEGFGLKHHRRTDRLLTLSEDLPIVAVAVDERTRIAPLAEEILSLKRTGLVTLERARMLTGTIGEVQLPEDLHEATKLTVYLGRQERINGEPGFAAICELLYRRGIAGATVLLGVDGNAHGVRERARFFSKNANVPLMIIAVGAGAEIADVLPDLGTMLEAPLMTLERVRVCKRDGESLTRPRELPGTDEDGLGMWQKLMIYSSEQAQVDGHPQYRWIVQRLREEGFRGATVLRGIWGFHGDHGPHGDTLFQIRRRVPTVTVVIDSPLRILDAFDIVDEATKERGLVTSELVPALTALAPGQRHGGLQLAQWLR